MRKTILFALPLLGILLFGCTPTPQNNEPMQNETIRTIMARRSIRQYHALPVARDTMMQIMTCGINAANGQNKQSWEVRIVDNPTTMQQIQDLMVTGNPNLQADMVRGCMRGAPVMAFIARDLGYEYDDRMAFNLELSTKYIATVLGRGNFADVREIGIGNNLSAVGYYACGLAVFFIMALGIAFCSVRVKGERTMDRLLYSRGYGAAAQVAGEYLPYLAAVCLILFIPLTAVGIMSEFMPIPIAELENWLFRDFVALGFKIIPAVFAVTAMQFLLYELTSGMINSVLLQFTVAIIMGYIGGCFYPLNFMPESVQKVACVLPVGVASDYIGNLMTGEGGKPFACVLYGMALVALAFAVRRRFSAFERVLKAPIIT